MRFPCLVCLLLAGLAFGQAAPPATPPIALDNLQDDPVSTVPGVVMVGPKTLSFINSLGPDIVFFTSREHPISRLADITDPDSQFGVAEFSPRMIKVRQLFSPGPVTGEQPSPAFNVRPLGDTSMRGGGVTLMGIGDEGFGKLFQQHPQLKLFVTPRGIDGVDAIESTGGGMRVSFVERAPATDKALEVKVGPDDTVITLKSFCADATQQGDACKTVISRAQFEKLAEALQPGMSPAIRRQLATAYSRMLRMSTAAEKRALDKGPSFEEKMNFARMQILSQELSRALQEDAGKVTDGDIEDYYKKNESSYEQATFARIFVPRAKQIAPSVRLKAGTTPGTKASTKTSATQPPTEAQKKAAEAAMKKVAADIHARAATGEDPDKLQKEAYADAGLPGNAPNTKMEKVRRTTLPANHQAVMDLKPGEVSEVISDPNSGHYIYKLVSKETLSLETVKPEIKNTISSQRYRDSMQGFQGNVDLNDAYFGPVRNPAMPPPPRGARPRAQQGEDDPD
jgi:hypothetical protein